uniref:Ovule protein n=1 Tax=Ascaris lumbricoides TaxID=6252 RepID=A0A0M3I230_ASCLU
MSSVIRIHLIPEASQCILGHLQSGNEMKDASKEVHPSKRKSEKNSGKNKDGRKSSWFEQRDRQVSSCCMSMHD